MARKKITIELTSTESAHLMQAVRSAQTDHESAMKKRNPALDSIVKKLDAANQGYQDSADDEADTADK